jgi:hypothetical protein
LSRLKSDPLGPSEFSSVKFDLLLDRSGVNDLDDLGVRDDIPGGAEMFDVLTEAFIMLILDGLQTLSGG